MPHEQTAIIRKSAENVGKDIGKHGGHWQSFVDGVLNPKTDPLTTLLRIAAKVQSDAALRSGEGRVTYRRMSRRPSLGGLLRPVMLRPFPKATCIIDTSGSMSDLEFRMALGWVKRALARCCRQDGLRVVCGDTDVTFARAVKDWRQIELKGRGGTNMSRIIRRECELPSHKRPDVIWCVTDGYTPWPRKKTVAPLVAVLTSPAAANKVPKWAEKVILEG